MSLRIRKTNGGIRIEKQPLRKRLLTSFADKLDKKSVDSAVRTSNQIQRCELMEKGLKLDHLTVLL
jgi:hypothetical protein